MNQILAVENDQKNNKKKKKNTTADIKNVITVFCVLSCSSDNSSNEETKATVKDIYVCGYEKKTNEGKFIATVWKNGVVTSLTDGTKNADANDIFVAGKNIMLLVVS